MRSPLISIIIPTFNSALTLSRALDSITVQNFTRHETIIMDSCSTDTTVKIVERYKSRITIHVHSEADKGIYDAMNKGIERAKGEWIYFLGSDDYLFDSEVLSNFNEKVRNDRTRYLVVYGNVTSPILGDKYDGEFDVYKILTKNICHQAIFYKKEIFDLIGCFNLRYKVLADKELNLRCFFHKKVKVMHIDLVVAYFAEGGYSTRIKDKVFYSDYPNTASIVKKYAYKKLPLREIKTYCGSNAEFLSLCIKRCIY